MMNEDAVTNRQGSGGVTALGVPLEPGERVLWAEKTDSRTERVIFAVLGVIFLIALVGVVLLIVAYLWPRWQPRGAVLTDRRVIAIDRRGAATSTPIAAIRALDAERAQSNGSAGGLLGGLVAAAVDAVADHLANKNPQRDPAYWKRAVAVRLERHSGPPARVPTRRARELGPQLARMLDEPEGVAQIPTVACEP